MFKVTVAGNYVTTGRIAQIEYYEASFELAEGQESLARAIIQNSGIIDDHLRKTKKNFKRWQTCGIIQIEELKDKKAKEEDKELEELLIEATNLGCIPSTYKRLVNTEPKKKALVDAIERKKKRIEKAKAKTKEQLRKAS